MEKPYSGRATLNESYDGVEIIIPSRKQWGIILFLCVWLCGWAFGLLMVGKVATGEFQGQHSSGGPGAFTWIWLTGWTIGGLFAMRIAIWSLFGKEVVTFRNGELTIARKGLIPSFTKTYSLLETKDFRVGYLPAQQQDFFGNARPTVQIGTNIGLIWFDYGMKTIRFGAGIEEAEAKHLLQRLKEKRIIADKNPAAFQNHA